MSIPKGESRGLPRRIRMILVAAAALLFMLLFRRALTSLFFQIALAVLFAWAARPIASWLERRLPPGLSAVPVSYTHLTLPTKA